MKGKKLFIAASSFFIFTSILFSQANSVQNASQKSIINIFRNELTVIPELTSKDSVFSRYSKTVEKNYKLMAAGKAPEIEFFQYKVPSGKKNTIFSIASRCNITYDTLATLNGIESSDEDITESVLIIPTAPGLFINRNSSDKIQALLIEKNQNQNLTKAEFWYKIIDDRLKDNTDHSAEEFLFLPNTKFDSTIRYYFLDSSLSLPLKKTDYWISSQFGIRENPFSGDLKQHNGIDLAAEEGTPVLAASDGTVSAAIKNDSTFGNYIILVHRDRKYTSVYAHLKSMNVTAGENVKKGDIIGFVGMTGMATGPHLHFEIKQGGTAKNPEDIINFR